MRIYSTKSLNTFVCSNSGKISNLKIFFVLAGAMFGVMFKSVEGYVGLLLVAILIVLGYLNNLFRDSIFLVIVLLVMVRSLLFLSILVEEFFHIYVLSRLRMIKGDQISYAFEIGLKMLHGVPLYADHYVVKYAGVRQKSDALKILVVGSIMGICVILMMILALVLYAFLFSNRSLTLSTLLIVSILFLKLSEAFRSTPRMGDMAKAIALIRSEKNCPFISAFVKSLFAFGDFWRSELFARTTPAS